MAHLFGRILALSDPVKLHRRSVPSENLIGRTETANQVKQHGGPSNGGRVQRARARWIPFAGEGGWDKGGVVLTAILERGGIGTHPSGGSSVPKISAVPATRRTRRGASGGTSTRSSLRGSSLNCRGGGAVAPPAVAVAAMGKGLQESTARVWAAGRGFGRQAVTEASASPSRERRGCRLAGEGVGQKLKFH